MNEIGNTKNPKSFGAFKMGLFGHKCNIVWDISEHRYRSACTKWLQCCKGPRTETLL